MLIPKYEYGDPILPMEVVLPTGDIFKTGTASDTHTQGAYPEGPGIDFLQIFHRRTGNHGNHHLAQHEDRIPPAKTESLFCSI